MTFTYGDEKSSYVEYGNSGRKLAEDYSINGYFTHKSAYTNQNNLGVIMVGFKPWGLQPFLDFELGEITNTSLDLNLLKPAKFELSKTRSERCIRMKQESRSLRLFCWRRSAVPSWIT